MSLENNPLLNQAERHDVNRRFVLGDNPSEVKINGTVDTIKVGIITRGFCFKP